MLYHHRRHLTSRKARVEHLHLLQKKCPQKWPPWQAWWKTKESQTGSYSTHKKWQNVNTKMSNVCAKKYQERNWISLCSVWCSFASRRLLHTISHAETLLNVCSKFQVFISYSFRVIIFFTEIMKEGAVDHLNSWHFNASGYLNSRKRKY